MTRPYREITPFDVGQPNFNAFGRVWRVTDFMGHIADYDVGKRVYETSDILQVESNEQRDARLGVCPNCGQWQHSGDCLNDCKSRGFA
ncbi:MAG: hypothetical protein GY906_24235 [bacterium]|nr:hypothetical protein [bacterium]